MKFRTDSSFRFKTTHFLVTISLAQLGLLGCAETTTLQGNLAVAWQRCNDENWFPDYAGLPIMRARVCEAHIRQSNGLPPAPPPTSIMDVRPIVVERPTPSAPPPTVTTPRVASDVRPQTSADQLANRYYSPIQNCLSIQRAQNSNFTYCIANACNKSLEAHFSGGMWTVGAGKCNPISAGPNPVLFAACEKNDGFDKARGLCRR